MAIAMTGGVNTLCRNDSPSLFASQKSSPLASAGAKMWMRCLSSALNRNLNRKQFHKIFIAIFGFFYYNGQVKNFRKEKVI